MTELVIQFVIQIISHHLVCESLQQSDEPSVSQSDKAKSVSSSVNQLVSW